MSDPDVDRLRAVIRQVRRPAADDRASSPPDTGTPVASRASASGTTAHAHTAYPHAAHPPRRRWWSPRWWLERWTTGAAPRRRQVPWTLSGLVRRLAACLLIVLAQLMAVWAVAVVRSCAASGTLADPGSGFGAAAAAQQIRLLPDLAVLAVVFVLLVPRALVLPLLVAGALGAVPYDRLPGRFVPLDLSGPLGRWAADVGTAWHGWAVWAALVGYLPTAAALTRRAWLVLSRRTSEVPSPPVTELSDGSAVRDHPSSEAANLFRGR